MPVTFISFFFKLDEDRSSDRSINTSLELFKNFVGIGIRMIVFIDYRLYGTFSELVSADPNIEAVSFNFEDSDIRKITKSFPKLDLPIHRTDRHDTEKFMEIMNAKVEFVRRGIEHDNRTDMSYAWIDFNIFHVLKDKRQSIKTLKSISVSDIKDEHGIILPGCWSPMGCRMQFILDAVNWRFCGGFFMGSKTSLLDFDRKNAEVYEEILRTTNKIIWEVNVWHYIEYIGKVHFTWFSGDHNDTILQVPQQYLS